MVVSVDMKLVSETMNRFTSHKFNFKGILHPDVLVQSVTSLVSDDLTAASKH